MKKAVPISGRRRFSVHSPFGKQRPDKQIKQKGQGDAAHVDRNVNDCADAAGNEMLDCFVDHSDSKTAYGHAQIPVFIILEKLEKQER